MCKTFYAKCNAFCNFSATTTCTSTGTQTGKLKSFYWHKKIVNITLQMKNFKKTTTFFSLKIMFQQKLQSVASSVIQYKAIEVEFIYKLKSGFQLSVVKAKPE